MQRKKLLVWSSAICLGSALVQAADITPKNTSDAPKTPPTMPTGQPKSGTTNVTELPPVVVTASPLPSSLFDLAAPVTVLSGESLQQSLATTLGETLANQPGITSTYFGPNASRPIIRGLDADHLRMF